MLKCIVSLLKRYKVTIDTIMYVMFVAIFLKENLQCGQTHRSRRNIDGTMIDQSIIRLHIVQ